MRSLGILAAVLTSSSCTLLFSPHGAERDAGGDGGGGAAQVHRAEPAVIEEGRGGIEDPAGSGAPLRGVPLVLHGERIPQGAVIEVEWNEGPPLLLGETVVSSDGAMAAAPLGVPVLTGVGSGNVPVDIRVRLLVEGEPVAGQQKVEVTPLDELVPETGITRSADELAPRYSRIEIDQGLVLEGDAPVWLVANERLSVSALVRARGGTPAAGPGGCEGGAGGSGGEGQNGLCPEGGHGGNGRGGSVGEGGGGAGHVGAGDPGLLDGDPLGGSGGKGQGNPDLYPLSGDRGYGGGGGGGPDGGTGGGGGGVVALASLGELALRGPVNADGGDGEFGGADSGGGGGGAGGAILIRAHGRFVYEDNALLSARPGVAGGSSDNGYEGGAGAAGRVRFDVSLFAEPRETTTDGTRSFFGLFWEPRAIIEAPRLDLQGAFAKSYDIYVGGERVTSLEIDDPEGTPIELPELEPGLHRVCALVPGAEIADLQPPDEDEGGAPPHLEAGICIDVAYVP